MKYRRNNVVAGMLVCLTIAFMSVNIAEADDLILTITATANQDVLSYVEGESYTFSVSINEGYPGTDEDRFTSTDNAWNVYYDTDPVLIASISGDGLSGTYQRPSIPTNYIDVSHTGNLISFGAWDNDEVSIGLTVDGNDVFWFDFYCTLNDQVDFQFSGFRTNPVSYFQDYLGTYTVSGASTYLGIEYGDGGSCEFTVTEMTIGPVPEPATISLLIAGGVALLRRRNKK